LPRALVAGARPWALAPPVVFAASVVRHTHLALAMGSLTKGVQGRIPLRNPCIGRWPHGCPTAASAAGLCNLVPRMLGYWMAKLDIVPRMIKNLMDDLQDKSRRLDECANTVRGYSPYSLKRALQQQRFGGNKNDRPRFRP